MAIVGGRCCNIHTRTEEFIQLDAQRRAEVERTVATASRAYVRDAAARRLRAMDRRALKYAWLKIDPRTPGALITFRHPSDRARCEYWLAEKGFPVDAVSPSSGEMPSARCIDRCLWAAMRHLIKENIDEAKAMVSVRAAHRDDARFFAKLAAAGTP